MWPADPGSGLGLVINLGGFLQLFFKHEGLKVRSWVSVSIYDQLSHLCGRLVLWGAACDAIQD